MINPIRPEMQRKLQDSFDNTLEAHFLLDLIAVEFQSDQMSVQCFDKRIVDRVIQCVQRHRHHVNEGVVGGFIECKKEKR